MFRPRLLVYGDQGMGQQYIGGAILNRFERLHVQTMDLSTLYSQSDRVSLKVPDNFQSRLNLISLRKQQLCSSSTKRAGTSPASSTSRMLMCGTTLLAMRCCASSKDCCEVFHQTNPSSCLVSSRTNPVSIMGIQPMLSSRIFSGIQKSQSSSSIDRLLQVFHLFVKRNTS